MWPAHSFAFRSLLLNSPLASDTHFTFPTFYFNIHSLSISFPTSFALPWPRFSRQPPSPPVQSPAISQIRLPEATRQPVCLSPHSNAIIWSFRRPWPPWPLSAIRALRPLATFRPFRPLHWLSSASQPLCHSSALPFRQPALLALAPFARRRPLQPLSAFLAIRPPQPLRLALGCATSALLPLRDPGPLWPLTHWLCQDNPLVDWNCIVRTTDNSVPHPLPPFQMIKCNLIWLAPVTHQQPLRPFHPPLRHLQSLRLPSQSSTLAIPAPSSAISAPSASPASPVPPAPLAPSDSGLSAFVTHLRPPTLPFPL